MWLSRPACFLASAFAGSVSSLFSRCEQSFAPSLSPKTLSAFQDLAYSPLLSRRLPLIPPNGRDHCLLWPPMFLSGHVIDSTCYSLSSPVHNTDTHRFVGKAFMVRSWVHLRLIPCLAHCSYFFELNKAPVRPSWILHLFCLYSVYQDSSRLQISDGRTQNTWSIRKTYDNISRTKAFGGRGTPGLKSLVLWCH